MSSSYYSRLDSALKTALDSLVTLEHLRIVSIEFTVMRDKEQLTLLRVEMLLCAAEQKEDPDRPRCEIDVENLEEIT